MENYNHQSKIDTSSPNRDEVKKKIIDKFDFDTQQDKLEKQKQAIFDDWDKIDNNHSVELEKDNPIKEDLYIKIEKSQLKKYYTRNVYPNGVELKVNREVGTVLRTFNLNGTSSVIQSYDGRRFVLAEVDGVVLPFYSSSNGTDGKSKGEWYPFYGFSEAGWVMKDGFNKNNEWEYNNEATPDMQEKIKETAKFLSKNIILPFEPSEWVSNLKDYFSYQGIDDKTSRVDINNALGLPKDFDTQGITPSSGHDTLSKIQRFILQK